MQFPSTDIFNSKRFLSQNASTLRNNWSSDGVVTWPQLVRKVRTPCTVIILPPCNSVSLAIEMQCKSHFYYEKGKTTYLWICDLCWVSWHCHDELGISCLFSKNQEFHFNLSKLFQKHFSPGIEGPCPHSHLDILLFCHPESFLKLLQ